MLKFKNPNITFGEVKSIYGEPEKELVTKDILPSSKESPFVERLEFGEAYIEFEKNPDKKLSGICVFLRVLFEKQKEPVAADAVILNGEPKIMFPL